MKQKDFDSLLEKVRAEIQRVDHVNDAERSLLQKLESDIHDLLEANEASDRSTLAGRVRKSIEQFQLEYPRLTAMLSEISNILNNAGV